MFYIFLGLLQLGLAIITLIITIEELKTKREILHGFILMTIFIISSAIILIESLPL